MFGINEIVGKSHFKAAEKDELLVTSRFFTLQGEGPYRGQPAYFIRLAKCNLACSFCDTYFDKGEWYRFDQLLAEAEQVISEFFSKRNLPLPAWAKNYPRQMVLVITGGEPSLQNNLGAFLKEAQPHFAQMQIESNGTSLNADLPEATTLVVSPKCLEEQGKALRYLEPNTKTLARADCLKFVMSAPEDGRFAAYSEIPAWALEWREKTGKAIFISPMNIYQQEPERARNLRLKGEEADLRTRSEVNEVISFWEPGLLDMGKNQRNHEYAAEYCLRYGLTLNLQVHLFASLP